MRDDKTFISNTEAARQDHAGLDRYPLDKLVDAFVDDQLKAVEAVRRARSALAAAIAAATPRIAAGGRLVYVGAGTSGRLGMLDGVELTPTFSWPKERIVVLMAGGPNAFVKAVENAEDDDAQGFRDVKTAGVNAQDVVLGIAASGRTPYVLGALKAAREAGALTIGISNNPGAAVLQAAEMPIALDTGPEVIAGSTRLKAGTSQKIALNTFSSAVMVGLNKVYGNLMVDMQPTNAKLRHRALEMAIAATGVPEEAAVEALGHANYNTKVAIVALLLGVSAEEATARLASVAGSIHRAVEAERR